VGHELHFDVEESIMEEGGAIVHPLVSSVVYLSGSGGDPTLVIDETMHGPRGTRAFLVHPACGTFMTFPGDRLHGVLPGPFRSTAHGGGGGGSNGGGGSSAGGGSGGDGGGSNGGGGSGDIGGSGDGGSGDGGGGEGGSEGGVGDLGQRLVLLIAWYGDPTLHGARRSGLVARSSVPRVSRSQTWPAALQLQPRLHPEGTTEGDGGGEGAAKCEGSHDRTSKGSSAGNSTGTIGGNSRGGSGGGENGGEDGGSRSGEGGGCTAGRVAARRAHMVPAVTPVWTEVEPSSQALAPPSSLRQHFFLQRLEGDDVRVRLTEEHGVAGTWTAASRKCKRPRQRPHQPKGGP